MTPTNQPRTALAQSASILEAQEQDGARLLRLWVDLTRRAASAAAHHSGDEAPLRHLQLQVEEAIARRLPEHADLMAELWVWESTLVHVIETPPEACLICRKARLGLPADLPLPAAVGGGR